MFAPRPLVVAALALVTCADRPLGATETGTSDATTTTTSSGTTIEPTTAVPPLPSTTTSDDSAGTTLDPNIKLDLLEPRPGLTGCSLDAPAGTALEGATDLGPFMAQRAYFGWSHFDNHRYEPQLLFVSPGADPAVEVLHSHGNTGAILYGNVSTDPFDGGGWVGEWSGQLDVFDQGQLSAAMGPQTVIIDALAGNWDEFDPADPPRLVGSIQGPISGPFDAVFCDELNVQITTD